MHLPAFGGAFEPGDTPAQADLAAQGAHPVCQRLGHAGAAICREVAEGPRITPPEGVEPQEGDKP